MLQFAVFNRDENSKDVYGKQEGSNPIRLRLPRASVCCCCCCCCSGAGKQLPHPAAICASYQQRDKAGVLHAHLHFSGSRAFLRFL